MEYFTPTFPPLHDMYNIVYCYGTRTYKSLCAITISSSSQIPPQLFLDWSKKLGGTGDKWAVLGSKLGLVTTDDINFYKDNPRKGGNGELILRMWKDSDCSYRELVAALRDEDIRLDKLATQIESHFTAV